MSLDNSQNSGGIERAIRESTAEGKAAQIQDKNETDMAVILEEPLNHLQALVCCPCFDRMANNK